MLEGSNIGLTAEVIAKNVYFEANKKIALERAGNRCEHPEGCEVTDPSLLEVDHLTPRCIGELYGWTYLTTHHFSNLNILCSPHHREKDETTMLKKSDAYKFVRKGKEFRLGDHR